MKNTIKIYSFPLSGHAHRVELFASIAGIEHDVIQVKLTEGEHKQADYLAINPDGQVPAIKDGDVVVTDSNAILVYLARKYAPKFLPTDPVQEAQVQKYLTMAAGELAYGAAAARLINVFNASLDMEFANTLAERMLSRLDRDMENKTFLVAEQPSIADIALYSYIAHAPEGGISLADYPFVKRLLSNIEQLPGFKAMPTTPVGLLA